MSVTVKIENTYSDGHTSKHEVLIDSQPPDDIEEMLGPWFQDQVWPHTGDGYGEAHPELGAHYIAEIVSADREELLGEWFEWV